jgi:hypothetical protein
MYYSVASFDDLMCVLGGGNELQVSEVRADNGCMYVVPKEFDEYRDRDDVQVTV